LASRRGKKKSFQWFYKFKSSVTSAEDAIHVEHPPVSKTDEIQGVFKKIPNFCYKDFIAHFTTF
jgi:hypothetical protein